MSTEERVYVLQGLGYTQREAAFLCIAALHSGYFLRRQFLSYIEGAYGKSDTNLTKKVLERRHAKATVLRYNQTLYHLCSKPLYTALGESDNRNRREHFVFTIKARLMALDYVLQHRNATYLATEHEKVRHFRDTLGINCQYLPSKRYTGKLSDEDTARYFVDKYPIAIADGPVPLVRFCYIDEGLHSTSGFERYLEQYRKLFARLSHFQLVYVASFPDLFDVGRKLFSQRILQHEPAPVDPLVARLLAYFRTRQAYERRGRIQSAEGDPISRGSGCICRCGIRTALLGMAVRR